MDTLIPQFKSRLLDARRQRLYLVGILLTVSLVVAFLAIFLLYETAFDEEQARLVEAAQSQARLMEAVARFDSEYSHNYPGGTEAATLSQFIDAHKKFKGFGTSGEFLLARREGEQIVFLLSHRHSTLTLPESLPLNSDRSPYLTRALKGESGTMVARDYRNIEVLAAYEPIRGLDFALVAKINLDEIRAPFYQAGLLTLLLGIGVMGIGVFLFWRLTDPLVDEIFASREQMRNLYHHLEAIREDEKTRIAREVHDELGQSLTALKIELTYLEEDLGDGKTPDIETVQGMTHLVDATIESVQRISTELRPQILDVFGLGEAIRSHAEDHLKYGLAFDLSNLDTQMQLHPDQATTLFRIFQEALTNTLRHANATQVTVKLYNEGDRTLLEILDNGTGIEPSRIRAPESLGLRGMMERAQNLGGQASVSRNPEGGTRVRVTLPIQKDE